MKFWGARENEFWASTSFAFFIAFVWDYDVFINTAGMIVTLNSVIPNSRIAQTQMFFSLENISAAICSPCYLD